AGCAAEPTCEGEWCGTMVIVAPAEADVLLPPVTTQDVGIDISDQIFWRLADVGADLRTVGADGFVPQLAEAWQFDDSLTLRFTLHPAARWHDGRPVTAGDVAFTFEVYRDTLVGSPTAPRLRRIASVTAHDEHTVVFRFTEPYAEQFFDATYHMRILPRHLLDTIPRDALASHPLARAPMGNGPFRFVRWTPGESIEIEGDSTFFRGRPGLRRVLWRFVSDPSAAATQLLAGEADAMEFVGGRETVERIASAEHLRVVEYPSSVYAYLQFNLRTPGDRDRPHPLFADPRMRRAVSMAVNAETLIQAIFGDRARVPAGPVHGALWVWTDNLVPLPYDTARARRLLTELGWRDRDGDGTIDRDGDPLAFGLLVPTSSAARRQAAQIIQDQLRRIGIDVEITELEFNAQMARAQRGEFDVFFGAYGGDISPATIGEVWSRDAFDNANYGYYHNPAVDRLLREAERARDTETAQARWREVLTTLIEDAPAVWIYTPEMTSALHRRLADVTLRPDRWLAELWRWRVPSEDYIDRDRIAR
ncbi:MAG: ABC transporter substrate-binding protein, partial [Gemmatimonadales bacterium]